MKEIYQLPDSVPTFFRSDSSEKVLVEFVGNDVLYVVGAVDVDVVEGEVEAWGHTMTAASPTVTLHSSALHGLISIGSADGRKAVVALQKSRDAEGWRAFMDRYAPDFSVFDVTGTRLVPPKPIRYIEEQLNCLFDLGKTPISSQRLVIEEQWQGFCDDLLGRPIDQPIKVLLGGYKNSGKTTMMHYFINKCLKKWNKILVLDFDIGQSEFFLPACISAFIVDTPLLGPSFTHLLQPFKSYFFESNDCMTDVPLYNRIVEQIVDDINNSDLVQVPCFINTMGFVEGPGLEILYNIILKTKPSDVVQLKFNDNQNLNLHSDVVNEFTNSSLSYDLWYFTSVTKHKLAKAPYLPNVSKHIQRNWLTTSYFSKCLKGTNIYFNDVVPYIVNVNNISIKINNVDELTQDESLDILNANVIALCISSDSTDLCECVGFGIVRCVNKSTGDIFVATPVAPRLLDGINQIRLGYVYLPSTFYTEGTRTPKYVCVKQDNIFNEYITRHYKVMS